MTNNPLVLYKYCSPDLLAHVLPRNGTASLRLTQPGALNDPFESVPALSTALHDTDMDALAQELTRFAPDNPVSAETVARLSTGLGVKAQQAAFLHQINKIWGIISFTTTFSNALMWSHYGRNATGFVIGYDFNTIRSLVPDDDGTLEPVIYETERPVLKSITEITSGGPCLTKTLLTKSSDWMYEKEWRLILPLAGATPKGIVLSDRDHDLELIVMPIPPEAIVEAYCTEIGFARGMYDQLRDSLGGHFYRTREPKVLHRSLRHFNYEPR